MADTDEIYLDHAASAPLRPEARAAWLAAAAAHQANPTGAHWAARRARQALDEARARVAAALGAEPGEVVFTSGGSEADNLAVTGGLGAGRRRGRRLAVTSAGEHHAVLEPVERSDGRVVPIDRRGLIDCRALAETLAAAADGAEPAAAESPGIGSGAETGEAGSPDTGSGAETPAGAANGAGGHPGGVAVVSVIAVNNEVGSITPLAEVAEIVRSAAPDALLHTDAVQAVNWIDVAAETAGYDLVSVTGHKIGAPVGIGALVVRAGVGLDPLIVGGGQERGRRAGTPDVAGAAALAAALEAAVAERDDLIADVGARRDRLLDSLIERLGDRVRVSAAPDGDRAHLAAGFANVCFEGVQSEALLFLLDEAGVRASAASSCSSGAQDPSHVLAAMGVPRELALGSLRLSLGRTTADSDIDRAVEAIVAAVERLDRHGGG